MKQTEQTIVLRTLHAEAGHLLTQSDDNIPADCRILTEEVVLAATDAPANWREITVEEADAIRAQQQQVAEQAAEQAEADNNEDK